MAEGNKTMKIPRVSLGAQGLEVSRLGFSFVEFNETNNGPFPEDIAISVTEKAFEDGITFFDASDSNEVLVRKAIKQLPREQIHLATKFSIPRIDFDSDNALVTGSPKCIRACCEDSLKHLDVDYIDLYYQPCIDTLSPVEDAMRELKKLVDERKIKYIGLFEASPDIIRRAHAVHPITAVQMEWSLCSRAVEEEIVPICRELGIAIVACNPIDQCFLGGKAVQIEPSTTSSNPHPSFSNEDFSKNISYAPIAKLAKKHGCSLAQLALAWVLNQGEDVVPISGTTKMKDLDDNIRSVQLKLTPDDIKEIHNSVHGHRFTKTQPTWNSASTPAKEFKVLPWGYDRFHELYAPAEKVRDDIALCWDKNTRIKHMYRTISKKNKPDQSILTELSVLQSLSDNKNEHVLRFHRVFDDKENVYIVFEGIHYRANTIFEKLIGGDRRHKEIVIKRFFTTVLKLLLSCHSNGIVCRMIRFESFLYFDFSSFPTVIDLGAAVFMADAGVPLIDENLKKIYCAPEIDSEYGPAADIYNIGVLMYFLYKGITGISGKEVQRLLDNNALRSIIFQLVSKLPGARPSLRTLQGHPWFYIDPHDVMFNWQGALPLWLLIDSFWKLHSIDMYEPPISVDDENNILDVLNDRTRGENSNVWECYNEIRFRRNCIPLFRTLTLREKQVGDLVEPELLVACSCSLLRAANGQFGVYRSLSANVALAFKRYAFIKLIHMDSRRKADMQTVLGQCFMDIGNFDEAYELLKKAHEFWADTDNFTRAIDSMFLLLECLRTWGKVEEMVAEVLKLTTDLFVEAIAEYPHLANQIVAGINQMQNMVGIAMQDRPGYELVSFQTRCIGLEKRVHGLKASLSFVDFWKSLQAYNDVETKQLGVVGRGKKKINGD